MELAEITALVGAVAVVVRAVAELVRAARARHVVSDDEPEPQPARV